MVLDGTEPMYDHRVERKKIREFNVILKKVPIKLA